MEVKKDKECLKKVCSEGFDIKSNQSGSLFIEGFANKSIIDRGKDLIPGNAWNLDNYMKAPRLLYQHGKDPNIGTLPIGKVQSLQKSEDGLKVKAEVYKLEHPYFKVVYDLVKRGGLNTFSVGFNSDEYEDDDEGVRVIKEAELLELSIVNIPMNQESTFELVTKAYSPKSGKDAFKNLLSSLIAKDAWQAARIHGRIAELQESEEAFNREEALSTIADISKMDIEEVKKILSGELLEISEEVLEAIAEVLGLDKEDLIKLAPEKSEPATEGEEAKQEEDEEMEEGDEETEEEEKTVAHSIEKGRLADFIRSRVSDLNISNEQLATATGVSLSAISQLLNGKIRKPKRSRLEAIAGLLSVPIDVLESLIDEDRALASKNIKLDGDAFQACVEAKIPILIREGKDRDQAVAQAIAMCKEKNECELTPEKIQRAMEFADNYELPKEEERKKRRRKARWRYT